MSEKDILAAIDESIKILDSEYSPIKTEGPSLFVRPIVYVNASDEEGAEILDTKQLNIGVGRKSTSDIMVKPIVFVTDRVTELCLIWDENDLPMAVEPEVMPPVAEDQKPMPLHLLDVKPLDMEAGETIQKDWSYEDFLREKRDNESRRPSKYNTDYNPFRD